MHANIYLKCLCGCFRGSNFYSETGSPTADQDGTAGSKGIEEGGNIGFVNGVDAEGFEQYIKGDDPNEMYMNLRWAAA